MIIHQSSHHEKNQKKEDINLVSAISNEMPQTSDDPTMTKASAVNQVNHEESVSSSNVPEKVAFYGSSSLLPSFLSNFSTSGSGSVKITVNIKKSGK